MRTEATPGQWFCVVWTACRAAAPPSTGGDPSLVVLAAEHGAQKTFLGHLVVSGGTDEPFLYEEEVQHQDRGSRVLRGEQGLLIVCGLLSGKGRQQDWRGQDVTGALNQFQSGGVCGDLGGGEG